MARRLGVPAAGRPATDRAAATGSGENLADVDSGSGAVPSGTRPPRNHLPVGFGIHGIPSRRRVLVAASVGLLALVALFGWSSRLVAAGGASAASGPGLDMAAVGGLDLFDIGWKTLLVLALLLVALRVLGRMGGAGPRRSGHLNVLESRSLASKASLHLVAVGDRRLVVGLTPNGLVALAELDADELATAEAAAAADPAEPAQAGDPAPLPAAAGLLAPVLGPIDGFAARLATLVAARPRSAR